MHTKEALISQLKDMGIRPDDTVAVHISMRAVGPVDTTSKTGAEVIIDALRDAVPDGLVLIAAHTWSNIRETPVFDIRSTMPCVGALPAVAVKLAAQAYDRGDRTCIRSKHPSHSVVAFGREALAYTADDAQAVTPAPLFGCYGKLVAAKGKILLIGVDLCRNTFIHAVDQALVPEHVSKPFDVQFTDYDGSVTTRIARNCRGVSGRNFGDFADALDEAGALSYGKFGNADTIVCDAVTCFDALKHLHDLGQFAND